jgi:hypothetical protein
VTRSKSSTPSRDAEIAQLKEEQSADMTTRVRRKGHVSLDASSARDGARTRHESVDAASRLTVHRRKPRRPEVPAGLRPGTLANGKRGDIVPPALSSRMRDRVFPTTASPAIVAAATRLLHDMRHVSTEGVTPALARAIEGAYAEAYGVRFAETWRECLVRRLYSAKWRRVRLEQGQFDRDPTTRTEVERSTSAREVLAEVARDCAELRAPRPPKSIDVNVVTYLLEVFNPGGGGGKGGKLSETKIEELLSDLPKLGQRVREHTTRAQRQARGASVDEETRRKTDTKKKSLRRSIAKLSK